MKRNSEFHDYVVLDILGDIPSITSTAMFGGYGLYKEGKIFALIIDDELYFKAGEKTKNYFKAKGSRPFTYKKKDGKTYTMNYWLVSEDVMENREKLGEWVDKALEVSL